MAVLLCVLVSVTAANYVLVGWLQPKLRICVVLLLDNSFCVSFLFFFLSFPGVSLNISGSSSHAVLNEPFTFTCTVTQAAGLSDSVYIYKKTKATVFAPFYQSGSSCIVISGPPPGYTVACGSGTDSSSSSTKNYILKINRASEHDTTDWWCLLNTARTRSQNFSLEVYSASLVLSGSSPHAVLNESFTLTCTVTQAANLDDKVVFYRKTTFSVFASLKQINTSCAVFSGAPTGYTASCGSGTNNSSSSTKKYTLLINRVSSVSDSTDWWCELYYSYKRSRNFSLQVYSEYMFKVLFIHRVIKETNVTFVFENSLFNLLSNSIQPES
ncbi:uncharacterized protein LOC121367226 [Gigantopelta aegis]|uniref:uncharacterized protein LOC121367226 n=1 Tax=Gigantopelta aegis TaxID=1735272 RepID=UPI001B88BD1A|nr:uncharacterized protein LOC121367226 [Gigantopelta aegis]